VFAGGIGKKSAAFRKIVVEQVACLGFEIDGAANERGSEGGGPVGDVGREGAGRRTLVVETDEQFEMARGCAVEARTFKEGRE